MSSTAGAAKRPRATRPTGHESRAREGTQCEGSSETPDDQPGEQDNVQESSRIANIDEEGVAIPNGSAWGRGSSLLLLGVQATHGSR